MKNTYFSVQFFLAGSIIFAVNLSACLANEKSDFTYTAKPISNKRKLENMTNPPSIKYPAPKRPAVSDKFPPIFEDENQVTDMGKMEMEYDRGNFFYRSYDYVKAVPFFKFVEANSKCGEIKAKASVYLGYMYSQGLGVDKDEMLGRIYLQQAGNAEDPETLYELGNAYFNLLYKQPQWGLKQADYRQAVAYFTQAKEQGHAAAAQTLKITSHLLQQATNQMFPGQ